MKKNPLTEKIIENIKRNRISSTEIADCLGKTGAIPNVRAINRGHFQVGKVFWSYAYNESNWELHEQLRNVPAGSVVIVESFDCNDRALFGYLVSKFLILYRQVSAIVVQGNLRDIPHLIKENWPIWCTEFTPIGCFNKKNEHDLDKNILKERRKFFEDSLAVCDDSGVVMVKGSQLTPDFIGKLNEIELQEDEWFDAIDRLKLDTFETVCLKKYKNMKP